MGFICRNSTDDSDDDDSRNTGSINKCLSMWKPPSTAWCALMRRNLIYRRRNWLSTLCELLLPVLFVVLLVVVKDSYDKTQFEIPGMANTINDDEVFSPEDHHAFQPMTFGDALTAIQARKLCKTVVSNKTVISASTGSNTTIKKSHFEITGLHDRSKNWQIPYLKCDSRKCMAERQDATSFCEVSVLALTGADEGGMQRARDFSAWLYQRYPILSNISVVQVVEGGDAALEARVRDPNYGRKSNTIDNNAVVEPKISMGVVFRGNDPNKYAYRLRQNATNFNTPEEDGAQPGSITTPRTTLWQSAFSRTDFEVCDRRERSPYLGTLGRSCTGQYLYNGVLAAQRLVQDFVLADTGATAAGYGVSEAGVQFVQFPQPPYRLEGFFDTNESSPILLALGLLYTVASMISYIVQEKELRQKELMKMMSVTEWDIESSWFCTFLLLNFLSASLATFVSSFLFSYSSPYILWLFWMLVFLSITLFATALATFCSKATRGVLLGLLVFFSGVFFAIALDPSRVSAATIHIVTLHPSASFCYGIKLLGNLEDVRIGASWDTMHLAALGADFSFAKVLGCLAYSCVFWAILTWYFNRVMKPDYGQALPFWFAFSPAYWKSFVIDDTTKDTEAPSDAASSSTVTSRSDAGSNEIPVEPVSAALRRQAAEGKSIEIVNLRKSFGDKTAVNGLNLSMYGGQITALLGHNGAGKTTTINMLTGAMAPTSGTATIAGKDIRTQMTEIRRDVGVCMQHDCLFPKLTVREHVEFFSRLKGVYREFSKEEADKHVDQAIEDVALSEKRHTRTANLSGGMKRKLSVAIAFCGKSKLVILDEPTSGMDPFSRRFTWNVIRHYRQDRIIILTTHFMDEADILGDRIAIMAEGQLRCAGSSLYLKKIYGVGYQLTIEKNQVIGHPPHGGVTSKAYHGLNVDQSDAESIEVSEDECIDEHNQGVLSPDTCKRNGGEFASSEKLKKIVVGAVSDAKLLGDVGSELSYQLPLGSASKFTSMFELLDEEVGKGSISCYGVGITTLDEVFVKVTRGEQPKQETSLASSRMGSKELLLSADEPPFLVDESGYSSVIQLEDEGLFLRHLQALLKKRAAIFRRDKKAWLFTTILPSFFVLLGFLLFTMVAIDRDLEPVNLDASRLNDDLDVRRHHDKVLRPSSATPISVNSPGNPFLCQVGTCSHKRPFVQENSTNETYFFCGFQAKLGINTSGYVPTNNTCTVTESSHIMNSVADSNTVIEEVSVRNVSEASLSLLESQGMHAASQYGGIWFTHEQQSVMNDGSTYASEVISQCELISPHVNYSSQENCVHYRGIGYVVQYNFTLLHVAPLYQAIADEAIVRHATSNSDFVIEATIAPLPVTLKERAFGKSEDGFSAWFLVILSFPFISGAYGTFIVTERASKAKHIQSVSGVEPSAYWLSTFIWDVSNYQIPLWITIGLMFAFQVDILTTSNRNVFSGVVAALCLYGPASAGFTYCISFAFQSASLCNITVIITGFLIGMGGPLTCFVLILRSVDPRGPEPHLADVANILAWFLRWNPSFCLGKALFNSINIDTFVMIEKDVYLNAWSEPILQTDVFCLAVQSIVYLLLAIQIDKWSTNPHIMSLWRNCRDLSWVWRTSKMPVRVVTVPLTNDDDVVAEQELVLSGDVSNDLILIKKLTKVYDNGKVAVNNLSLGVAPGECFGLLGINGAGKTTAMGLLTAEFAPTSGDAILGGFSVSHEPQKIRRRIGYCPQFCAHFENLTGREHLEMYAAIKGIPKLLVIEAVSKKLKEVGLSDYDSDRLCVNYSGGMKRRLSLACATIGQPQIVFLDECSTGVDPVARREIWQLVSDMVVGRGLSPSQKPAVILTTHSMEECEALCPRIGIMANGRLMCLGSAQHLKSKFGKGYQLELKVQTVDRTDTDFEHYVKELQEVSKGRAALTTSAVSTAVLEDEEACPTASAADIYLNLEEAKAALAQITGDEALSQMIDAKDPIGFTVYKDAMSVTGVDALSLAAFCCTEIRMRKLEMFISMKFPIHVLRERQDNKARYEVDCESDSEPVKISSIFASIEEYKEKLRLADYSVSQTSLEQVFNMHAAEAERMKLCQIDG